MNLQIGKTISHYRLLEQIGQGGMGVVYKAEDTKLKREVALKFLPTNALQGQEEKDRFIREAQAAAALNHPNIATIFAIDEADGQLFIAMEFIEGRSLEHLINIPPSTSSGQALEGGAAPAAGGVSRPLPLDDAIGYATQIAAGLQAAHEKGVVHRDIKSANIMVTDKSLPRGTGGVVKIMDFGLAKLQDRSKMTQLGTTLGTAAYMSPEQARGEEADIRADTWSLGVVLYEMISGQLPFKGDYEQAVIYSIINEEPEPLTALRSGLPITLDGVIAKALSKNPDTRYQHVDELPADLKGIDPAALSKSSLPARTTAIQTSMKPTVSHTKFPWLVAAVFFLTTLLITLLHFTRPNDPSPTVRSDLLPPPETTFANLGPNGGHIALSPDGRQLAFVTSDSSETLQLWVRDLSSHEARKLHADDAYYPFWSPDSRFIGFFSRGTLKRIDVLGGPAVTICDAVSGTRGGTWNRENIILFSPGSMGMIHAVSADGGKPIQVTIPDTARLEISHRWPHFLPDGKHFLYFARPLPASGDEGGTIYFSALTGPKDGNPFQATTGRPLLVAQSDIAYAEGYLLFMRQNTLMAQQFDADALELSGEAIPVATGVQYGTRRGRGVFSVSQNGILVYQVEGDETSSELLWLDREGNRIGAIGEASYYSSSRISPDGNKIAFGLLDRLTQNEDVWIYDRTRDFRARFTFSPFIERWPIWSPAGDRVVFASGRKGRLDIYEKTTGGAGTVELRVESGSHKFPEDWSSDGSFIVYSTQGLKTGWDLWTLNMVGDRVVMPYLQTPFAEIGARFSPDTKWLIYQSDESGRFEVYVRRFPSGNGKLQISSLGGVAPRWRADGKELFFVSGDEVVMAAKVQGRDKEFEVAKVETLFNLPEVGVQLHDVTADGQNFLLWIPRPNHAPMPLTLVVNWAKELQEK